MDPLYKPVLSLIEPFIVYKYKESREEEGNPRFANESRKEFDFNQSWLRTLMSDRNLIPGT